MTKNRAIKMLERVQEQYPELLSYDTTIVDTVFCDTIQLTFPIPCDTLVQMLPGDTIYLSNIVFVKDSSGSISGKTTIIPEPVIIEREIKVPITTACPPHKYTNFQQAAFWSGIVFWLLLILLILFRWQPSMK